MVFEHRDFFLEMFVHEIVDPTFLKNHYDAHPTSKCVFSNVSGFVKDFSVALSLTPGSTQTPTQICFEPV